jgi:hypothetical protein
MVACARTVHRQRVQDALPLHTGISSISVRPASKREAVVADASFPATEPTPYQDGWLPG